ncbi:hypothetical protein [Anaerospora sp.]|uniref:hypothetical protein n=1 Tax=Anaerospora sp. TaxID=1960278 RepID=UPI0028A226D5|nr:hypothetical protein [Anaerospora sp.]
MATIGQPLSVPEAGWRRYDNADSRIKYIGDNWVHQTEQGTQYWYNNTVAIGDYDSSMLFKFYGTKIRFICRSSAGRSDNIQVIIDDSITEYFSNVTATVSEYRLNYEKTGLELGHHTVRITNKATNGYGLHWDCMDIDADGYLVLSKALLAVTMADGARKEYELAKTEVDSFINWYNTRDAGSGSPYYTFSKPFDLGPFESRTDYLVFDKIQDFEIMEFEE